mgnify:CR=1 FL=1
MLTNVRFEDLKNIENVKTAVEHISLYVGLVVFTALGAKVGILRFTWQARCLKITEKSHLTLRAKRAKFTF